MGTIMRMLLFAAGFCFAAMGSVQAATCANVATVSATSIVFGTVNPFVLPQDSTGIITLQFTNSGNACNQTSVITLSVGTGAGATAAIRKMTSGVDTLNYTIYTPPGPPTTVWDNVTGYTTPSVSIPKNGNATQMITMYGRVLSGQANAPIGSYTDTVVITLTF
jgi:spore coat protein U-like protein